MLYSINNNKEIILGALMIFSNVYASMDTHVAKERLVQD
jgi:hypothetical protein